MTTTSQSTECKLSLSAVGRRTGSRVQGLQVHGLPHKGVQDSVRPPLATLQAVANTGALLNQQAFYWCTPKGAGTIYVWVVIHAFRPLPPAIV